MQSKKPPEEPAGPVRPPSDPSEDPRYSRQVLFPGIGPEGQRALARSTVALVGLGALGAPQAELLARAGVGELVLIDRDVVETSNLGRQALYDTEDGERGRPKAVAAARHLQRLNPLVRTRPLVAHLDADTIEEHLKGAELVLDGTDNFSVRYLLNDWAIAHGRPWIYGGTVAARGMTATIRPGHTPCLRCFFPDAPAPGSGETCETSGVIGPAAHLVAALQVAEALKLLVGDYEALRKGLLSFELWPFQLMRIGAKGDSGANPDCPACVKRELSFLHPDPATRSRTLAYCGRDSVQVVPARLAPLDLDALQGRLAGQHRCRRDEGLLVVELSGHRLTVFDDGRALVSGTGEAERALALYDRYVGS